MLSMDPSRLNCWPPLAIRPRFGTPAVAEEGGDGDVGDGDGEVGDGDGELGDGDGEDKEDPNNGLHAER